ncbi:hypothetical protein M0805_007876 [Coniferiporia weirii]|nr:hypothetical protein M0805_007876 [Coniferiporia weirii]
MTTGAMAFYSHSLRKPIILLSLPLGAIILLLCTHIRAPWTCLQPTFDIRSTLRSVGHWIQRQRPRGLSDPSWSYSFFKRSPYRTYQSPEEEAEYWEQAERAQKQLSDSDSRLHNVLPSEVWTPRRERLIPYYTPRLLPEYRENRGEGAGKRGGHMEIPAKLFVKWHWLVFPNRAHPTILQASQLMQKFSHRDLHEIFHIARLVRDVDVSAKSQSIHSSQPLDVESLSVSPTSFETEFSRRWRTWLETKDPDPDVVICFENA